MSQGRDQLKTQTSRRKDGRLTVTLKVIGWTPADVEDLARAIESTYDDQAMRLARALRRAAEG